MTEDTTDTASLEPDTPEVMRIATARTREALARKLGASREPLPDPRFQP